MVDRGDDHRLIDGVVVDQRIVGKIAQVLKTAGQQTRQTSEHFGVISQIGGKFRHDLTTLLVGGVEGERRDRGKKFGTHFRQTLERLAGTIRRTLIDVQDLFDKVEQLRQDFRCRAFVFRTSRFFGRRTLRRSNAVVLAIVNRCMVKVCESSTLL